MLALPRWMPRLAFAPPKTAPRGDALVCVFLRGAADVLNMVVPHGDDSYYTLRPTLAIARPDDRRTTQALRATDLDGFFGLHPALAPLLSLWQRRELAIVHACGAPDESRSHFAAMDLVERGVSTGAGPPSGWIGRHLAAHDTGNQSPLRAIGIGEATQRALYGPVNAAALTSIADFHLGGSGREDAAFARALAGLYESDAVLASGGRATIELLSLLERLAPGRTLAGGGAIYPAGDFGTGLAQIARLIVAEVGLEAACIDLGGWDTHVAQGGGEGLMARLLADLAGGLAAMRTDLGDTLARTTVVVMSEFGRRAGENGGLGTDHGHGSMMMVIGGGVRGGRVYGVWPGLSRERLVGPGDLAVTTDYRDVLGEVVLRRLGNSRLDLVFPDYAPALVELCAPL